MADDDNLNSLQAVFEKLGPILQNLQAAPRGGQGMWPGQTFDLTSYKMNSAVNQIPILGQLPDFVKSLIVETLTKQLKLPSNVAIMPQDIQARQANELSSRISTLASNYGLTPGNFVAKDRDRMIKAFRDSGVKDPAGNANTILEIRRVLGITDPVVEAQTQQAMNLASSLTASSSFAKGPGRARKNAIQSRELFDAVVGREIGEGGIFFRAGQDNMERTTLVDRSKTGGLSAADFGETIRLLREENLTSRTNAKQAVQDAKAMGGIISTVREFSGQDTDVRTAMQLAESIAGQIRPQDAENIKKVFTNLAAVLESTGTSYEEFRQQQQEILQLGGGTFSQAQAVEFATQRSVMTDVLERGGTSRQEAERLSGEALTRQMRMATSTGGIELAAAASILSSDELAQYIKTGRKSLTDEQSRQLNLQTLAFKRDPAKQAEAVDALDSHSKALYMGAMDEKERTERMIPLRRQAMAAVAEGTEEERQSTKALLDDKEALANLITRARANAESLGGSKADIKRNYVETLVAGFGVTSPNALRTLRSIAARTWTDTSLQTSLRSTVTAESLAKTVELEGISPERAVALTGFDESGRAVLNRDVLEEQRKVERDIGYRADMAASRGAYSVSREEAEAITGTNMQREALASLQGVTVDKGLKQALAFANIATTNVDPAQASQKARELLEVYGLGHLIDNPDLLRAVSSQVSLPDTTSSFAYLQSIGQMDNIDAYKTNPVNIEKARKYTESEDSKTIIEFHPEGRTRNTVEKNNLRARKQIKEEREAKLQERVAIEREYAINRGRHVMFPEVASELIDSIESLRQKYRDISKDASTATDPTVKEANERSLERIREGFKHEVSILPVHSRDKIFKNYSSDFGIQTEEKAPSTTRFDIQTEERAPSTKSSQESTASDVSSITPDTIIRAFRGVRVTVNIDGVKRDGTVNVSVGGEGVA